MDRKERTSSAVFGVIATFLILLIIFNSSEMTDSSLYSTLGIALNAYALALSPSILFKRVSVKNMFSDNLALYGGAAILSFLGTIFLIFGWFLI